MFRHFVKNKTLYELCIEEPSHLMTQGTRVASSELSWTVNWTFANKLMGPAAGLTVVFFIAKTFLL